MPNVIIIPDAETTAKIGEVRAQGTVPHFRTLLILFDEFIMLAEKVPPAFIQMGSPRGLFYGDEIEFLSRRRQIYASLCDEWKSVRDAARVAQENFSKEHMLYDELEMPTDEILEARDVLLPHSIAKGYDTLSWCLDINFLGSFVTPADTVPYDDIVRFRQHRASEYLAFWDCLYEMANDADAMRALSQNEQLKTRILKSVGEYRRVTEERWMNRVFKSIGVRWVLDAKGHAAFAAAAAGSTTDTIGFAAAVTIAGVGPLQISLNLRPGRTPMSQSAQAMSYIVAAQDYPI
jgi:hypothetical protein